MKTDCDCRITKVAGREYLLRRDMCDVHGAWYDEYHGASVAERAQARREMEKVRDDQDLRDAGRGHLVRP